MFSLLVALGLGGFMYADDRERYIRRLPGAKKQPHENTKQVVERFAGTSDHKCVHTREAPDY